MKVTEKNREDLEQTSLNNLMYNTTINTNVHSTRMNK